MTTAAPVAPIEFAPLTAPRVSVLVPVYGQGDLALACLRSIAAHTEPCVEVVVVDNASPDGAADLIESEFAGVRLIRSPLNLGFGAAVDLAALHARGEHLLILNSDVAVEPRWLPPLLEVLDHQPSVAAVTPSLVDGDGSVHEAGSVLFSDSVTEVIALDGPWDSVRPRAVPYASAACLLIRREAFSSVGGFDTTYVRGYYEDVDLALLLRARGDLVVCVPRSRVRHVGGASSSPERADALVLRNKERFQQRWPSALAEMPPNARAPRRRARERDSAAADRILVIDDRVPHVDRGSGDPRAALLLTRMATRYLGATITLLASDLDRAPRYAPALAATGVEVADWADAGVETWLSERRGHYSAVVLGRSPDPGRYRQILDETQPQAIRVVDVEAARALRLDRRARLLAEVDDPLVHEVEAAARAERQAELDSWRWADLVTCVSEDEAALVRRAVPGQQVSVLAWGVERSSAPPMEDRRDLAFLGGFMSGDDGPNADAARHLVDDLMPLLWGRHPDLRLTILGADPTASILARAGERVDVVGRISDPRSALGEHLVQVAPLRFGSGIKLKLIDSMASGTPFVTTSIGAEGLHLDSLAELVVADSAEEAWRKVDRLLTDAVAWNEVQSELLHIVARHFAPAVFDAAVDHLMAQLGAVRP